MAAQTGTLTHTAAKPVPQHHSDTGASRIAALDPISRGVHIALAALGDQLAEYQVAVPPGVTNGDLVLSMRDTHELRARLCRTKGAARSGRNNPAVAFYLEQLVHLADTCAHARRAFLPGYDALAADVIRRAVVTSCRDPRGLELVIAYEPGNIDIALEVISHPATTPATLNTLVQRWVAAGTTAPDEKRLAISRAIIEARPADPAILEAVADGCMDMVLHYDQRELEAAFEAARTAARCQVVVHQATLDDLNLTHQRSTQQLARIRQQPAAHSHREVMALEMTREAVAELIGERKREQDLPRLLQAAKSGGRLTRREMRELRRSGLLAEVA